MRIKRGCGCMFLVLAAVNLLFVISGFIGLVGRNVDPIWLAFLAVILFSANVVPSLMLGLAGVRNAPIVGGAAGEVDAEPAAEEVEYSGMDENDE